MKTLITLVKMQFKEKLNTRNTLNIKHTAKILLSIIVFIAKFALSSFMCAVMFFLAAKLPLFEEIGRVPDSFLSLLFSIMLLLSVFSCMSGLTKAMYFSKDNFVLLTLPSTPIQVYLSKLIIFFLFDLKKNFSFLIPMFVGYFITHGHPAVFYPWLLICFVFISALTVAIAALLSIPAMWISTFFRQNKLLQNITIASIVAVAILSLFYIVSIIPEDLNLRTNWDYVFIQIQNWLNGYKETFALSYALTQIISGALLIDGPAVSVVFPVADTFIRFGILIAITAVLFVMGLVIVRPLFYKMASKPFEYLKTQVKPKKNRPLPSWFTPFNIEIIKSFKDYGRFSSNVGIMISTPILIFLLNSLFVAMNTDTFGNQMIVAFNLLIILLISLNANSYASTIYSRDGRSAYMIKIQPKNPLILLVAKIVPTALFCLVSLITTFVILTMTTNLMFYECVMVMIAVIFIYLAHLMYCANLDIINPHTEIYAAMGEYENDPNELKATAVAFAVSFIVAGATLLLLAENSGFVYLKLLLCAAFAFVYRAYRFVSDVKLYYKEK